MVKRMIRPLIGMKKAAHSFAETNLATQIQASPIGKILTNANAPVWEKWHTMVKRVNKPQIGMKQAAHSFAETSLATQIQASLTGKILTNANAPV
jgi:HAMP domain-containing protein